MSVTFLKTYPRTDEQSVEEFEQLIGSPLPADYRSFLLTTNGGQKPEPEGFKTETGERSMLSYLYPVGDGNGYDLQAHFHQMRSELPNGVIRIGEDIGGNPICLAVTGEAAGAVLFMDHEVATGSHEEGWDNLYFCARSFTEFMESLRDE
jgi:SMI1-KNR4 cell-wall